MTDLLEIPEALIAEVMELTGGARPSDLPERSQRLDVSARIVDAARGYGIDLLDSETAKRLQRSLDESLRVRKNRREALVALNVLKASVDAAMGLDGGGPSLGGEAFVAYGRVLVAYDKWVVAARRSDEPGLPPQFFVQIESLRELYEQEAFRRRAIADLKRTLQRNVRLAERRERQVDGKLEGRVCSSCGKKPAKVDDLCKRCAHDAGTLPHGKIV